MSSSTIARPIPHEGGLGPAWRHTVTIGRRNLLHIKSDPEQLIG